MRAQPLNLKRATFILAAGWTMAIVLGAGWHLSHVREHALDTAYIQASHSFEKDLVYRRWASDHGGVYVPVTEETPPNPYLSHIENRDVLTDSGLNLTLVNPACMTRQVHELAAQQYGHRGHITSLNPIRPGNAPDAWEVEALRAFARGEIEVSEIARIGGTEYLRLMRPLITEEGCLKCHAVQGYQVGDQRGGISVSVPMAPLWTLMYGHMVNAAIGYGLIWLLGLGGIGFGVVRMNEHIRERELALEDREKQQEWIEQYLDVVEVIFIALDREARISQVNRKGCELLGYDERDLIGRDWFATCLPEELADEVKRVFDSLIAGEVISSEYYENPIRTRSGDERFIAWHNALVRDTEGQIIGLMSSGEDITERKQVEEEKLKLEVHLRQQQRLEAIGTLAGGVAHEINNPITGIMNYAQLIDERLDAESPLREFAEGIGHETKRVAAIVSNLLAFARQDRQSHSPASIADIVNDTVSLIGTIIRRDQITLEVNVPDDLPEIKCRSQQIQQVLMNLLTNARDALNERYAGHDPDKIMTVTVRSFEKAGRPWLRTTVEDHGAGIPDEIRDSIFDPFVTTKDRAEGTGLGLSISHGIVQEHRGKLTFECEAGRYTRFHLDLPVDNGWSQHPALDEASEE